MSAPKPSTDRDPAGSDGGPLVSVIVPTRQRPELLARAVTSIVRQDYAGEIECLLVFDQEEPIRPPVELPPRRSIVLLTNERNPGLAGGRNTGILAASGDLVAFCDDDDEWLPSKIREQVALLATTPAVNVVVTGITVVRDSRTTDRVPALRAITLEDLVRSRVQEIHPSSIVARRSALVDGPIGLVDEAIPGSYGEDYDWLLRAGRVGPIAVVRAPLVRAHWHRSSFFADRWRTIIDAIQYLLRKHPEFRSDPRGRARLYGRLAFANAAVGDRALARRWAWRTIRLNPRERRAYLALAVASRVISAESLMNLAHRFGRGI